VEKPDLSVLTFDLVGWVR